MLNISEELHNKFEAEIKAQFITSDKASEIAPNDFNVLLAEPISPPNRQAKNSNLLSIKVKKCIILGKDRCLKQDYEGALNSYLEAQKIDPDNNELKFLIKKVQLKLKEKESEIPLEDSSVEEGVKYKIITIKPKSPQPDELIDNISELEKFNKESKVAIPVSNLNGASIQPETLQNNQPTHKFEAPSAIPMAKKDLNLKMETKPEDKPIEKNEEKNLESNNKKSCISCNGTGKCYWCDGTGNCVRCLGNGTDNSSSCSMCSGSGNCTSCSGSGKCMWCHGKGESVRRMNTLFFK